MSDETDKCPHCGRHHEERCRLIKAVEYYRTGEVKRIIYVSASEISQWVPMPERGSAVH